MAAEEKANEEAENSRREEIRRKVDNLGDILFDLNSSCLTENDKVVLDELVQILDEHPTLKLKIEVMLIHVGLRSTILGYQNVGRTGN